MKNNKKKKLIAILVMFVILLFGNMKSCQALIGDRIAGYKGLVSDFDNNSTTNVGNILILLENKASLNESLRVKKDKETNFSNKLVKDIIEEMIRLAWTSREESKGISVYAGEIRQINDIFGFSYEVKNTLFTEQQKTAIIEQIKTTDKMYFVQKYSDTFGLGTEMYCIQHDAGVLPLDYQIENFVQIKGNELTKYHDKGSDTPTESTSRNDANAVLTYILNREYKDYTYGFYSGARQYAVRHYINTWLDSVGKNVGIGDDDDNWKYSNEHDAQYYAQHQDWKKDGEQFIKNATNYAPNYNKRAVARLSEGSVTMNKLTDEIPITLTYSGNLSITVKDTSGKEISSSDLEFKQDGKKVTINNIVSGKQFTIKNNSNQIVKTIDFNVTNTGVLCANLWFAKTTGYLRQYKIYDANGNPKTESQRFMIVKHYTEGKEASEHLEVSYRNGDLKIIKVDADDSNIKLENAEFILKKANGNWLSISNNSYTETSDKNSASVFLTDSEGVAKVNNLPSDTYTIYEKTTPTDYEKDFQEGYIKEDDLINCGSVTVSIGTTATKNVKNKKYGTLTITKKDEDTNNALQAGFKIHVGSFNFIGLDSNGEWTYNSTFDNAYTFVTGREDSNCKWTTVSNGSITIKKLKLNQTYGIWEVEAPEGYVLAKQDGYRTSTDDKNDIGKEYSYAYQGNTQLTSNNLKAEFNVTNIKTISIKGYVWLDEQVGKNNASNALFDTGESKIVGVTVRLMKKGDTSTEVPTTTTNSEGEYIFDNLVRQNEIDSYYVEFDYSGLDNFKTIYKDAEGTERKYINYIPVELKPTEENGSKAITNSIAEKDTDLAGIAMTYAGTDATSISNYGLAKVGTLSEGILSNVNLGIIKIPTPDYSVTENLETVRIVMKGYEYTYKYGAEGNTNYVGAPTVNYQKKDTIKGYTINIYPSDISYCDENSKKALEMYVKYRIDITNTMNYTIDELYNEKTLHIKSLTDTFDKNRYTLHDDNWTVEENGNVATIKDAYLEDIKNTGINLNNPTATKYIEFSVNYSAILDILNHPNGIIEEYPTKVTTIGYHKYTRDDYSWNNNIKNKQNHITVDKERHDNAPYLIFKLGPERAISGKVYKDEVVTNNGEVLGNGEYDNGEKGVADVNVELLDLNGTETDVTKLSVSSLYGVEGNGNDPRNSISKIAQVKTKEDGSYSLDGVVPGYYYLRFVYGNGTYKITDLEGKVINTNVGSKIDNEEIKLQDYKSTIVTNKIVQNALLGGEDVQWYKKIDSEKYFSVAIDNLEQRKAVNEKTLNSMMAGTAKVSITVENTAGKEAEVKQKAKFDEQGNEIVQEEEELEFPNKNHFKGLSFGIIEIPRQELEIKKLITNVKLSNSQGNVLYSGNPESTPSYGAVALNDLDNVPNGGSTYVRAEMAEENLYGTNLELTYEVSITNKSDINYYNNEYYWYGEKNTKKEVTLTPTNVRDYLDQSLTYIEEKSDNDRIDPKGTTTIRVDNESIKAQDMELKGWNTLYTNKNTSRNVENTTDKVKIVAERILSNNDADMEIISRAEIKNASRTPDPADPDLPTKEAEVREQIRITPTEVHTNGMVKAIFTITPPTGENRGIITIYAIAGIIALIILSTGIVIIKKKII